MESGRRFIGYRWGRGFVCGRFMVDAARILFQAIRFCRAGVRIKRPKSTSDLLANAKIERKTPLQLEGIRVDGPPHEILGVQPGAGAEEIQRAYRERMKQYHPDKVGPPGSREWNDAQKIAEAINRAKSELLKKAQAESPKRSGR